MSIFSPFITFETRFSNSLISFSPKLYNNKSEIVFLVGKTRATSLYVSGNLPSIISYSASVISLLSGNSEKIDIELSIITDAPPIIEDIISLGFTFTNSFFKFFV